MSSRMQRSSISPFRSHKAPAVPASKPGARPTTPSSISARTNTMSSSSSARPTTPSSAGRPTTPSSSMSSAAVARGSASSRISPVSGATSSFSYPVSDRLEVSKAKENVTVTVRFRPLSAREIGKGDEIAWYADGQSTVRNEYNPSIAYGFDRVFGPATTTRHVYDVAAHYVVSGAMQGINGTVFAYGVTSSGKTHTMHGEQKSPGIIPLAVKDVFSIIQETPGREFLLRVSYLEIYNEVINDLLDPAGQNLRIREDSKGTYVEGIKEEVVLSPAHALSLIASGEEHRHVGSNNFNLLSSRSHTIFTLTIESSPSNENDEDEEVTLSQLNLIDLAGSESSKTETTGLRRKEGSYINKSLLTLGTVISKLTDDKATHIPYRDSKLTRLLQSSLSGHGRISLICTVTPASSNSEETHNTLKFAHRSKDVEIQASQNKIIDEKSLIKKYQREISCLKEELQQLRHGIMEKHSSFGQEDIVNLKLQLEAGHVKLLSRLEEEEQAKAALMGRIQRLTKLILVSTKNTLSSKVSGMGVQRRRHSFGEDELAYLPDRKREYITEDDVGSNESELSGEGRSANIGLDPMKFDKKNRKRGVLGWLKFKKSEQFHGLSPNADYESSTSGSPFQASQQRIISEVTDAQRNSLSQKGDDVSLLNYIPEKTQAGELFTATTNGRQPVPTGITIMDEMDLLSEQVKLLAGEIALCTSSLKRLAEQASNSPKDPSIQEQMQSLKDEINVKKRQMHVLEQRLIGSLDEDASLSSNSLKMSQALSKLTNELGEKTFEHEIMAADNRILQDQLQMKVSENAKLQETVKTLYAQIDYYIGKTNENGPTPSKSYLNNSSIEKQTDGIPKESTSIWLSPLSMNECQAGSSDQSLRSQVLKQASEIENLKQKKEILEEEKRCLRNDCQKLVEEASYARDLAAAAAVELRNLAEEVTKLSYENTRLTDELAASKESTTGKISNFRNQFLLGENDAGDYFKKLDDSFHVEELKKELLRRSERESSLETALTLSVQKECELQKCIDNAKKREQDLENELANMWVTVAKLKRNGVFPDVNTSEGIEFSNFQKPDLLGESDADEYFKKSEDNILLEELQKELLRRPERESSLETALTLSVQREQELEKSVDNARKHEQVLENELANMWVTITKLQRNGMAPDVITCEDIGEPGFHPLRKGSSIENGCSGVKCKGGIFSDVLNEDQISSFEEPKYAFDYEKKRCKELQAIISKAEDLDGVDFKALEEMQDFHVEALSKICQEKLKDRVQLNQVGGTAN